MLQESLNNYFLIAAVAMGAISILMNWIYLIETAKGIYITDFSVLKNYVNLSFDFSLILLFILWITTYELDLLLIKCFFGLTIGLFGTILAALIIPVFIKDKKGSLEDKKDSLEDKKDSLEVKRDLLVDKKNLRKIIMPCIRKIIIMVVILWLIF